MLAKSKVLHECLHDAELTISGVKIYDALDGPIGKVYRGQQLVIMGRYEEGGRATVTLEGSITGEDRVYTTEFDFPDVDRENPEIERLWALNRIERLEHMADIGMLPAGESREAVCDLGVKYQLVTDETSMVILTDSAYEQRGIERRNAARTALEREARSRCAQEVSQTGKPARDRRVDRSNPMFSRPAPSSNGGGALDPMTVGIVLGLGWLGRRVVKRSNRKGRS
jgi:Ca-activated chloride channel family protein